MGVPSGKCPFAPSKTSEAPVHGDFTWYCRTRGVNVTDSSLFYQIRANNCVHADQSIRMGMGIENGK
jgi:hypothetical protein